MLEQDEINNGPPVEKPQELFVPTGWNRLSGVVRTAVKGLLPGRQMTQEELQEEMDAFYGNGGKTSYGRMSVEELEKR